MINTEFFSRIEYSKNATQRFHEDILENCCCQKVLVVCKKNDKNIVFPVVANYLNQANASYKFLVFDDSQERNIYSKDLFCDITECTWVIGFGDDLCSVITKQISFKTQSKSMFYALSPNMLFALSDKNIAINEGKHVVCASKRIDRVYIDENAIESCDYCDLEKANHIIEGIETYILEAELNSYIICAEEISDMIHKLKEILYSYNNQSKDALNVMDVVVQLAYVVDNEDTDYNSVFETALYFCNNHDSSFASSVDIINKIKINLYNNYLKIKKISIFDINKNNIIESIIEKELLFKKINAIRTQIKKVLDEYKLKHNTSLINVASEKVLKVLSDYIPKLQKSKMFEAIRFSGFI